MNIYLLHVDPSDVTKMIKQINKQEVVGIPFLRTVLLLKNQQKVQQATHLLYRQPKGMIKNYKLGPRFTLHKCNIANKIVVHNAALQVSLSNNHTYDVELCDDEMFS